MENQVYQWLVKKGSILIQKNEHRISIQLDYENGDSCVLAPTDADEIIDLLTNIAQQIWQDPAFVKKPYTNRLYQVNQNEYSWEIEEGQLLLKYNSGEEGIEIRYT